MQPVDIKELLALIGAKEVELSLLRKRVGELEAEQKVQKNSLTLVKGSSEKPVPPPAGS